MIDCYYKTFSKISFVWAQQFYFDTSHYDLNWLKFTIAESKTHLAYCILLYSLLPLQLLQKIFAIIHWEKQNIYFDIGGRNNLFDTETENYFKEAEILKKYDLLFPWQSK